MSTVESDASEYEPLSSCASSDCDDDDDEETESDGEKMNTDDQPPRSKKARAFPFRDEIEQLAQETGSIGLGDLGSGEDGIGDVTIKESDVARLREVMEEDAPLAAATGCSPMRKQGKRKAASNQ